MVAVGKLVAVILGILVVLAGFVAIYRYVQGQNELPEVANSFECKIGGGICKERCGNGENPHPDNIDCGENIICCVEDKQGQA